MFLKTRSKVMLRLDVLVFWNFAVNFFFLVGLMFFIYFVFFLRNMLFYKGIYILIKYVRISILIYCLDSLEEDSRKIIIVIK